MSSVAQAQGDLWSQGVELRRQHRDAEALRVFEQAHAQDGSARTLAQIALAEQALGRWPEAALHLEQALAAPDAWVQSNRPTLESARTEIARHVGRVEVLVDRAGAEIELGGRSVGRSPLPAAVPAAAGRQILRVRMGGRVVAERSIEVTVGGLVRESVIVGNVPSGSDGSPLPIAGGILVGVGAAAAVGMGIAWGLRETYAAQWNDDSRCLVGTMTREESCADDRRAAESSELAAIILGASAGALVAAGVVLLAIGAGGAEHASLECTPLLAGLVCRGRF